MVAMLGVFSGLWHCDACMCPGQSPDVCLLSGPVVAPQSESGVLAVPFPSQHTSAQANYTGLQITAPSAVHIFNACQHFYLFREQVVKQAAEYAGLGMQS